MTSTTTTQPAASTPAFLRLVPAAEDFTGAPRACPDGSGDLWWDDASYARYQAWDGPHYIPTHVEDAWTDGYCDGRAYSDRACQCHRAAADAIPF